MRTLRLISAAGGHRPAVRRGRGSEHRPKLEHGADAVRDGDPPPPETSERRLDALRWGLVPHFTKDLKAARKPIDARAETAPSPGMFRGALAARRCLVPADAFYEWRIMADGKQPYARARMPVSGFECHHLMQTNAWHRHLDRPITLPEGCRPASAQQAHGAYRPSAR